ncbi:GDSL-type esterase/lipase family protein [Streptomyces aidingensis]|uniref:Lysophospholipase L1 n=1 Tax=Streptomyces aidingensis TaxID=910347 RepID=A0A1I1RGR9_9ACTN|nr:GDSL-type esterase/lipase family protein [Streptomyces aidingensis]SFD33372.1 Lysophospholipase L1 [Streptomyces aidingensis]
MGRRHGGMLAALVAMVLLGVAGGGVLTARGGGTASAPPLTWPVGPAPEAVPAAEGPWVASWSAAVTPPLGEGDLELLLENHSVRNVVFASVGGDAVRVELSNRHGEGPLLLSRATVALAEDGGPAALPGTMRELSFRGASPVRVPAGREVWSDPVELEVPDGAGLLVTFHLSGVPRTGTYHRWAMQTGFVAPGDHAAEESGAAFLPAGVGGDGDGRRTTDSWWFLSGMQVRDETAGGAVVVLGDSLTDGVTSTPGANRRWTDRLAGRLRAEPGAPRLSVLNAALSGNRLLRDASPARPFEGDRGLDRLAADVPEAAGAGTLIVQLGINDIRRDPGGGDAGELVAGLRELAGRARAAGLAVVGATLAPCGGSRLWTVRHEEVRQRVNAGIRAGGVFDAVLDLDRALRDPRRPDRLLPAFDSGDHLHPNDAGYAAMAAALDLSVLGEGAARPL